METDQKEMEEARKAHEARASEIASKCAFAAQPISERAKEASKTLEMIFEELTKEIALFLPTDFRTALVLEHLECACMWAKKAIHVHDLYLINLKDQQNGSIDDN